MSYSHSASGHTGHQPSHLPVRSRATIADYAPPASLPANPSSHSKSPQGRSPNATPIARCKRVFSNKATWIGVSAIALSLLAIVPMRVDSESIDLSSCEKKIAPRANISRAQMSVLLTLSAGTNKEAVRRVVEEPYCELPGTEKSDMANQKSETSLVIAGAQREAYPLAFDPEAWIVVAYTDTEEYLGYDFVFKP